MFYINYKTPRPYSAPRRQGRALPLAVLALCGLLTGSPAPAWAAATPEVATMPTGASTFPKENAGAAPSADAGSVSGASLGKPAAPQPAEQAEREAADIFSQPRAVELFPTGAQITLEEEMQAVSRDGQAVLRLLLPDGAANVAPVVEGGRILRWTLLPVNVAPQGKAAEERRELLAQADALEGRIAALNARMELHKQLPGGADSAAVGSLDALAEKSVPALMAERQKLTRELEQLRKLINAVPALSGQGKRLEITLAERPAKPVRVTCTYTLHNCGWQPRYSLNARPGTGKVDITMSAEVWQYSGLDWDKARLALATRMPGELGPDALPDWIIEPFAPEMARAAVRPRNAKAVPLMAAAADSSGIPAAEDGAFVRWEIPATGLAQGKSILNVTNEEWAAPMQWLARPSAGESRVWMTAEYAFGDRPSWPAGLMECRIDGQYVGTGAFRPEAGKVKLFFGADPRVTVKTINETRKENESGIINARRFWRWSWRYAIRNERPEEVQVRLERPLPRSVDERVTLKLTGTPAPVTDKDEGILFWDVKVPARGTSDVRQEVEITAPADLKLAPVAP